MLIGTSETWALLCQCLKVDYPVVNMGKLLEAQINLMVVTDEQMKRVREPNDDLLEGDDEVLQIGNVGKLMNGIRNIQRLTLSSDTLEVSFLFFYCV